MEKDIAKKKQPLAGPTVGTGRRKKSGQLKDEGATAVAPGALGERVEGRNLKREGVDLRRVLPKQRVNRVERKERKGYLKKKNSRMQVGSSRAEEVPSMKNRCGGRPIKIPGGWKKPGKRNETSAPRKKEKKKNQPRSPKQKVPQKKKTQGSRSEPQEGVSHLKKKVMGGKRRTADGFPTGDNEGGEKNAKMEGLKGEKKGGTGGRQQAGIPGAYGPSMGTGWEALRSPGRRKVLGPLRGVRGGSRKPGKELFQKKKEHSKKEGFLRFKGGVCLVEGGCCDGRWGSWWGGAFHHSPAFLKI